MYDDGETPIPEDEAKRIAGELLARPAPKKDEVPLEDELPYADEPDEPAEEGEPE